MAAMSALSAIRPGGRRQCELVQKRTRLHLERLCQPLDYLNCRISRTALKIAYISPMNAGAIGELFLAPAPLTAKAAQIGSEALTYIHCEDVPLMSPIRLQTMSDNRLDLRGMPSTLQMSLIVCGASA